MGLLELLGVAPPREARPRAYRSVAEIAERVIPTAFQDIELQELLGQVAAAQKKRTELFYLASDVLSEQALCDALCEAQDRGDYEEADMLDQPSEPEPAP